MKCWRNLFQRMLCCVIVIAKLVESGAFHGLTLAAQVHSNLASPRVYPILAKPHFAMYLPNFLCPTRSFLIHVQKNGWAVPIHELLASFSLL